MVGYVKAEIKEGSKGINVDINAPSKSIAMVLAASCAAEAIENKADYNQFCKMLKNTLKIKRKRDVNEQM